MTMNVPRGDRTMEVEQKAIHEIDHYTNLDKALQ